MPAIAHTLTWLSDAVDRILRGVAVIFVVVMVATICLQVVARYGFASPPAWTEEAARYAMVWVGLLGASISYKVGFDPKLATIPDSFPHSLRLAAALLRGSSVVIFLGPILFYCFYGPGMNPVRSFLARNMQTTAESFDMPSIFVAASVPVFICAIFLHGLAHFASSLSGWSSRQNEMSERKELHATDPA